MPTPTFVLEYKLAVKTLRLHFCDFWPGFQPQSNYFVRLLRESYNIVFDEHDPELVLCSVFGNSHYKYFCRKLCFLGENLDPNYELFDYAISFRPRSDRNYRLPLYATFNDVEQAAAERMVDPEFASRRFCNFLYSNPGPRERIAFFELLNAAKQVDSGGRVRNTLGRRVDDKMLFLRSYRFSIAFENGARSGYITEKIFQPLLAGSIPIYWGADDVGLELNPAAYIDARNYPSLEVLRDAVLTIDADMPAMQRMIAEPIFAQGLVPEFLKPASVLAFLESVIADSSTPVAQRSLLFRLPVPAQRLIQQLHSASYYSSLQWRRLRNFSPEKIRFRRTSYSINNTGDGSTTGKE